MSTLSNAIQISIYGYPVGGAGTVFEMALTNSLTAGIGTLSAFTTEVSDNEMTVTDFEGLVKDTVGDEARFVGARRVENTALAPLIANFTDTNAVTFVQLDKDTVEITTTGNVWWAMQELTYTADQETVGRLEIRRTAGTGRIRFTAGSASGTGGVTITSQVTDEFQPFSELYTGASTARYIGIGTTTSGATGDVFEIRRCQVEDVTGQTNQNPSEYVSVGVGTEAEHILGGQCDTADDIAQWTPMDAASELTLVSGEMQIKNTDTTQAGCQQYPTGLRVGALYAITVKATGNPASLWFSTTLFTGVNQSVADDTLTITGRCTNASGYFRLQVNAATLNSAVLVDNISVKEIDHGSNVDGIKYFDYENGNTVSFNVVTEAVGSAIADATLKGVLIEEESTNFVHQSQDLTTWWTQTNIQIDTTDIIQNGSETLLRLEDGNTNSAQHRINYNITPDNTGTVTISCIVVDGDKSHVAIKENGDGTGERDSYFNPTTGVWDTVHANHTEGVEEIRAGVYRIWITTTWTTGAARLVCINLAESAPGGLVYVGTVGEGMHVGAIQVEELPYPTSYIPTEGSTVTRSASQLVYDHSIIDGTIGSMVGEMYGLTIHNTTNLHQLYTGFNAAGRGAPYHNGADQNVSAFDGTNQAIFVGAKLVRGQFSKTGMTWGDGEINLHHNGSTDSIPTVFDGDLGVTSLNIGSTENGVRQSNCPIKNIKIYNKILTDTKMQELTS